MDQYALESRTPEGSAGLATLLADPARAVIALDYDGTLAPIVDRPEDARPAAGAVEVLAALARSVGTVALLTGRPAAQVVALAGLDTAPGVSRLRVLGQYGLQTWDGTSQEVRTPPPLPGVERARGRLTELLATAVDGVGLEDKEQALVVHFRRAEDPAAAAAGLRDALAEIARDAGLDAHPGRHVLELRPPGFDKGGALAALVAERAARSVLFAGDDVGDLPAFEAVRKGRENGVAGVLLCSLSTEVSELATQADLVADGPDGVVALLRVLVGVLGDG